MDDEDKAQPALVDGADDEGSHRICGGTRGLSCVPMKLQICPAELPLYLLRYGGGLGGASFALFVFAPGPYRGGVQGYFCVILIHFPGCSRLLFLKTIIMESP